MTTLVFNPQSKDYFKAKACVAISMRYNYAGSVRSYRFSYLSFRTWANSYRAAFCYVFVLLHHNTKEQGVASYEDINSWLYGDTSNGSQRLDFMKQHMESFFPVFSYNYSPAEKLSFVYRLVHVLSLYNLGEIRYNLVSSMFADKAAVWYATSKYFPTLSFTEIENDFMFDL